MAPELLGVAVFCAGGELLARVGEAEPLAPPGAPGVSSAGALTQSQARREPLQQLCALLAAMQTLEGARGARGEAWLELRDRCAAVAEVQLPSGSGAVSCVALTQRAGAAERSAAMLAARHLATQLTRLHGERLSAFLRARAESTRAAAEAYDVHSVSALGREGEEGEHVCHEATVDELHAFVERVMAPALERPPHAAAWLAPLLEAPGAVCALVLDVDTGEVISQAEGPAPVAAGAEAGAQSLAIDAGAALAAASATGRGALWATLLSAARAAASANDVHCSMIRQWHPPVRVAALRVAVPNTRAAAVLCVHAEAEPTSPGAPPGPALLDVDVVDFADPPPPTVLSALHRAADAVAADFPQLPPGYDAPASPPPPAARPTAQEAFLNTPRAPEAANANDMTPMVTPGGLDVHGMTPDGWELRSAALEASQRSCGENATLHPPRCCSQML